MTREEFLKIFPELIKNYQPAPEVLAHIGNVELLMLIGPSGVGKTALISKVDLPFVLSDITRNPRFVERDGMDYYFRTDYDRIITEIKDRQFVQTAVGPGGDFYATRASSYPVAGPAAMAIVADVIPVFRSLGFAKTMSIFVVPPSYEEWMRRLKALSFPSDLLAKRLVEAKRSLEFALSDGELHFILNDEIDAAVSQTQQLLEGKVNAEREQQAKKIAAELLNHLSQDNGPTQ
jgi:guanylate kinase